jgi:hypothetical protein
MKARWFLVGLALAALGGCATDVGTIDRTQHEQLAKKQFAGVWYMNQTVIDIPYSGAWSFVGEMNFGATGKVVFDIQEDKLIAYPTVEYVEGSEKTWHQQKLFKYWDDACTNKDSELYQCVDGKDNLTDPTRLCCFTQMYVGQPVAIFQVLSHFDVTRAYNPQTGEQSNVLEENTKDNLWWQRKYMRVNWAKNLISDFTFMARIIDQSPIDYYVQSDDPTNPDAPSFTPDYFDVVTKSWGNPASTGACDIYGVSTGDCAPAVVKFRTAFRKVDPAQDYEPMRFHNEDRQVLFGYFLTERNTYDADYGLTDTGKVSFINRWNIWDKSFQDTPVTITAAGETCPTADPNAVCTPKPCFKDLANTGCDTTNVNGVKEFCQADTWFTRGNCVSRTPLPYTERGLRPVVYHVSADLPTEAPKEGELDTMIKAEMWTGSYRTAKSWSDTLKDTVAWLYLWEEKGRILGQNQVRTCATDTDCATHALVDRMFELDASNGDLPKSASGKIQWTSIGQTIVALPGGTSAMVPDWRYPTDLLSKCGVRLINLADGRTLDLAVNGATALTGVPALVADPNTKKADSQDPATPAHASVLPASNVKFSVMEGGTEIASINGDCPVNSVVTLAYDGTTLAKASAIKSDIKGLRVINMTGVTADLSIDAGLRMYAIENGGNSGYQGVSGGGNGVNLPADFVSQRMVLAPAGSKGDVTCYIADGVGRCAGYDQPMTAEDWTRLDEIKATLPDMFVMCRNTYTPQVEGGALFDDEWASNLYAPWATIKNASADQMTKLPVVSPCIDLLPGASKMTPAQKMTQAQSMKKIGDSRYSGIQWVSEAQFSSPLGYGPTAADPDSGQVFWGIANIYGAPLTTYGNMYRDLFDLISGKLDTADYVTGENIRTYLKDKAKNAPTEVQAMMAPQAPPQGTPAQTLDPIAGMRQQFDPTQQVLQNQKPISQMDIFKIIRDKNIGTPLASTVPVLSPSLGKQRLAALKGTQYEQLMTNTEVQYALDNDSPVSGSPLEWANIQDIQKRERERQIYLGKHAYCYGEFDDEGMLGMVQSWACIGDDPRPRCDEKTWDALDPANDTGSPCCISSGPMLARSILKRFYTAVVEHEVGHTMGLRHNFAASTDLFNYPDKYYDIRVKEPVPCEVNDECEAALGQYCEGHFCRAKKVETCTKASDCGFANAAVPKYDTFDCIAGQCVEITRCNLHGVCPAGSTCNGDDRVCYSSQDGVKTRVTTPVVNENDGKIMAFIPRAELTDSEAQQSRTIYQVSSIMDYGQRWNSDILDLGKYDKAAIRFGYGGLVDVYNDTEKLQNAVHTYYQSYGQDSESQSSDNLDTTYWGGGIFFSQFYFFNNLIGEKANRSEGDSVRNRTAVPYESLRDEHNMTTNYYQSYLDWTYIQVPYKFSGDEYAGNVGIYTWDTGVDALEIVHNMGIQLHDYYLMDAFKRERYGAGLHGNPVGYMTRVQTRYMDVMRGCGMLYALYSHVLKNYSWRGVWANAKLMGYGLRRASETGFEILASTLASPAPGSYKLNVDKNLFENISYLSGATGSELDIPLSDGKYPYTTFWNGAGYFFWDHAQFYGSFWEKMAALMTLTDSTVYFTTNYVGEQLNIGVGTSIGFNTMYPKQLTELFGGAISDSPQIFAGTAEKGGTYAPRKLFDPRNSSIYATDTLGEIVGTVVPAPYLTEVAASTAPRVEPSIQNITLKLYMMVYGMAYLPASFDPSFLDSFTVCLKGNGNCHDIGATSGIVPQEFSDPFTGKTFVVWAPTYTADWYSPNVVLVEKANAQKALWEAATGADKAAAEVELRNIVEVLDMMRGVYEVFSKMKI